MNNVVNGILSDVRQYPILFMNRIKRTGIKKLLLRSVPYLIAGYVSNKAYFLYRNTGGTGITKFLIVIARFDKAFINPLPSIIPADILAGIIGGLALKLAVYYRSKTMKKYRHGMEYGSARWGTAKDIAPYIDPVFKNNIILTQTERLTMDGRPRLPKYARNKNVIVLGGSGSGKTRFYVKPQLMQMHSSYVVTDPKGQILVECGKMLKKGVPRVDADGNIMRNKKGKTVYEPYEIKVFNTINFDRSMHYNPFAYVHSEKDILKLVNTLMENTKGEGAQAGDPFWDKAERLLYTAYIGMIWYEAPLSEQNFSTLIEMIDLSETREEDEGYENVIDILFKELEQKDPQHFAVRQYRKFKLAAGVIDWG